jgi:hypothetical protein
VIITSTPGARDSLLGTNHYSVRRKNIKSKKAKKNCRHFEVPHSSYEVCNKAFMYKTVSLAVSTRMRLDGSAVKW